MTYLPGTFAIIAVTIMIALILMHLATLDTRAQAERTGRRLDAQLDTQKRAHLTHELRALVVIARTKGSTVTDEDVDDLVLTASTDTLAHAVAAYRELVGK